MAFVAPTQPSRLPLRSHHLLLPGLRRSIRPASISLGHRLILAFSITSIRWRSSSSFIWFRFLLTTADDITTSVLSPSRQLISGDPIPSNERPAPPSRGPQPQVNNNKGYVRGHGQQQPACCSSSCFTATGGRHAGGEHSSACRNSPYPSHGLPVGPRQRRRLCRRRIHRKPHPLHQAALATRAANWLCTFSDLYTERRRIIDRERSTGHLSRPRLVRPWASRSHRQAAAAGGHARFCPSRAQAHRPRHELGEVRQRAGDRRDRPARKRRVDGRWCGSDRRVLPRACGLGERSAPASPIRSDQRRRGEQSEGGRLHGKLYACLQ
ncbi:uncharacterized protein [Miscanthus floridulus]|uniref:uncharacterized protein n=1 Tax=Miscanthus floridulus TaxID=154761 RepID=UPI003459A7CC